LQELVSMRQLIAALVTLHIASVRSAANIFILRL